MLRAIQRIVKSELAPARRLTEEEAAQDRPDHKDILRRTIAADIENLQRTASDPMTASSFERAADMLASATEVFCLGLRGLGSLAHVLGFRLGITGIRTHILLRGDAEMFEQLFYIGKSNALVAFAFQRYTKRTVDALELASRHGAGTLVITDSLTSPAAQAAAVSLICAVKGESFFNSYTAAVSTVNALISAVVGRRRKAARKALEELDELLPDEDFFGRGNGT